MQTIIERTEYEKNQDCTFRPETQVSKVSLTKSLHPDYTKLNTKAIEKFLERQIDARIKKEKELKRVKKMAGMGQRWKNEITVPITPKLSSYKPKAELSEQRPLVNIQQCHQIEELPIEYSLEGSLEMPQHTESDL